MIIDNAQMGELLDGALDAGVRGGRAGGIEQAAKVAENFRDGNPDAWDSVATTAKRIAAEIRKLAST